MRIEPSHVNRELTENSRSNSGCQTTAASNASTSTSEGHGQIHLLNVQAQVPALVAQVLQLAEVRQDRVTGLRDAVLSGSYSPGTEQVAGALLPHMVKPAASPGFVNTDSEAPDRRRKAMARSQDSRCHESRSQESRPHNFGGKYWMAGTAGNDGSSLGK
jgi:anti-sigma28 factor (negative regulator of flagellin synthesis)